MYALISEIDKESSKIVSKFWKDLCEVCGLEAIYAIAIPHFSWLVSEELDISPVKSHLEIILPGVPDIASYAFGLGIFSGEMPVLYLPMVKTEVMIQIHQKLWEKIEPHCEGINRYYSPSLWIPHITLALRDINKENLACAVNHIAFKPLELSVSMTSICIAEYENRKIGNIIERFSVN